MTTAGPIGAERAARPARHAGRDQARRRSSSSRSSATRSCTTSLLGIDPIPLGSAPFALATDRAVTVRGRRAGPARRIPGARVYLLPCIAGHVGADTAGRDPRRGAPRVGGGRAGRRRRHERRDRPRQPLLPARGVVADRAGLRGRPDLRRPARRAGRDRAGPDRPARPSSRGSGSSAASSGRTSPASPRRPPRPGSPGSAAPGSSR